MRKVGRCLGVVVVAIAFSLMLVDGASAEVGFCQFGSGGGECKEPLGLGVDPLTGNVYVADHGNDRVNVFDPGGSFLFSFGSTELNQPSGVAIDSDPTSPSYRTVYVVDSGNGRTARFDPFGVPVTPFNCPVTGVITTGSGGFFYLAGSEVVRKYDPSCNLVATIPLGPYGSTISLTVDPSGAIYVATFSTPQIHKYGSGGEELLAFGPSNNVRALAADASGNLYSAEIEGEFRAITEYNSGGIVQKRFGYSEIDFNLMGLAGTAAGDRLYGSEEYVGVPSPGNRVVLVQVPAPGPLACCPEAPSISSTQATVKAGINPEGEATTYHVQYVDDAGFKTDGFTGPTVKETSESASIGSDFTLHKAEAQIGCPDPVGEAPEGKCLTPDAVYHFRVVAANADGISTVEGEFETRQAPEVLATWATEVGTDSAQLNVTIDPLGIPTNGYFEYVDDAGFQANGFVGAARVPSEDEASLEFGSAGVQARFVQVTSLQPGTLYHYRIVASNPLTPALGPERTFTTFPLFKTKPLCENEAFRGGASSVLPDCRAYEMVSPVDKNGGDIAVLKSAFDFPTSIDQSAAGGERFTYSSATAFGGAVSAPYSSQITATRKSGEGWSGEPISPPRQSASLNDNATLKFDTEFKVFSADLSSGWLLHNTDPSLQPGCAPEGYPGIYRRDSSGGYEALTTAAPANQVAGQETKYWPEMQITSADGTHAVFRANGKLTANASSAKSAGEPVEQLYEHVSGKGCGTLRLVSVLPNGLASASSSSVGHRIDALKEGRENIVARALSADGSRIFWSVPAPGQSGIGPGALYARIDGKKTVQISAGPAHFWTAATDGSKVFYTLNGELFEFDVDKETQTSIAKGAVGVAEAGEDASRLYFVSKEALGGEGEVGSPNLFLRSGGGATRLVATLGAVESGPEGGKFRKSGFTVASSFSNERGTRTTPDGSHLAFVSSAPLTGYDNSDATDGRAALELFLYDAESDKLACISCNPSGARPVGRKFESEGVTIRVAAQMSRTQTQLYVPRNLSTDGNRLFFESFEALVARDGNGRADVYEWERAADQAQCDEKGADLFVPGAGGCLSLISSGQSTTDSTFLDASLDGHDAFFKTGESLLPQDPGLVDIYDARVGGGLPGPVVKKSPCEGEACQIPIAPPESPTPSSSVFRGPEGPKARRRCPKGKRAVRRAGKTRCVAKHKKRHGKKRSHDKRRAAR